jgi:hypothetical protein
MINSSITLRKAVRYVIIGLVVAILISTLKGLITIADILKAIIIGLCVSTANWWHEKTIKPQLEKIGNGETK